MNIDDDGFFTCGFVVATYFENVFSHVDLMIVVGHIMMIIFQ